MKCVIGLLVLQLLTECRSRGVPEESVISYQKSGTVPGDVYLQIATNLAEKLTTPISRFLDLGKNRTGPIFKKKWNMIETLDESKEENELKPVVNDLDGRDVEQLSVDTIQKEVKKPEKIYLPPKDFRSGRIKNTQANNSFNDFDSKELIDDGDAGSTDENSKEGGFVYFLELAGSFFQLLFGALLQLFQPSST